MVEGEHDSFDTSLVPDELLFDDDIVSSGQPSELSNLSQLSGLSSQSNGDWNIGGSQDNSTIQDFISRADDERVIMRSPFQPSVPGARRSPRTQNNNGNQSPDPEFYMPRIDLDGENSRRASSAGSARTVRPGDRQNVRQRRAPNPNRGKQAAPQHIFAGSDSPPTVGQRMSTELPHALYDILSWSFGIVGMAFRYAQKPLALALAIYFIFGVLILASNWLTQSFYAAISPVCNIPGLSHVVDLPFCPSIPGPTGSGAGKDNAFIDFDNLVGLQDQLPNVLEMSANSISLPLEMKRSESSIRDLRTMVHHSELKGKEELVFEFDSFIETARTASRTLQQFNVHVGSAVDSVISINRWTSRYLDGLAAAENEKKGLVSDLVTWAFAPFQPATLDERSLVGKYIEHTALVSDKIGALIDETMLIMTTLEKLDGHLDIIHDWQVRSAKEISGSKNEALFSLWNIVGANRGKIHNLNTQLHLLRRVGSTRGEAMRQVIELKDELEKIQFGLEELREQVAAPELAQAKGLPLSVHIETINAGVANLEQARTRIRGIENDRIRETLMKGREDERLIESS